MFNKEILWFDWRVLDKKSIVIEDLRLLFLFLIADNPPGRQRCWQDISAGPVRYRKISTGKLRSNCWHWLHGTCHVNIQYLFVCLDESQCPWKHLTCNPNADFVQRVQNRFDEYNKKSGWTFVQYLFNFFTLWILSSEKIGSLCLEKSFDIVR